MIAEISAEFQAGVKQEGEGKHVAVSMAPVAAAMVVMVVAAAASCGPLVVLALLAPVLHMSRCCVNVCVRAYRCAFACAVLHMSLAQDMCCACLEPVLHSTARATHVQHILHMRCVNSCARACVFAGARICVYVGACFSVCICGFVCV
jgi:hypothetical protein